jgi:Sulfotransferase family
VGFPQDGIAVVQTDIVCLERQYDSYLARPRVALHTARELSSAAARWSAAVWTAASAAGPLELAQHEIARALDIARRPVFVCGVHRSGTTLVRDLLDGHPALAILPAEGTFFTNLERRLRRQPREAWLQSVGCEWLRRLANPIHQEPYWLLGPSSESRSPYVVFARALMAWWPIAEEHVGDQVSSWPLVAVVLAYAHCSDGFSPASTLRRWGEKTPKNERFLERLRREFPEAKVIHVIRHPFAVYASHKHAERNAGQRFGHARQVLRDLQMSYGIALAQSSESPSSQYLLIRYEDLLETRSRTVDRLAAFLGIEPHPTLLEPTAGGLPARSNSSFTADAVPGRVYPTHQRWREALTRSDCERISAVVGNAAKAFGYELTTVPRWRARFLRFVTQIGGSLS